MIRLLALAAALAIFSMPAVAAPPEDRLAALRHGVNLTNWFRYPASLDPAKLRGYLSDAAMADLRGAGFGFVRLAVQPEILLSGDHLNPGRLDPGRLALLLEAIRRLQGHGLAVVIAPHPTTWRLESRAEDRASLRAFWHGLARALAGSDPRLTFPEVLNEPVFAQDGAGWAGLQQTVVAEIRAALPHHTIVLTGQDWGSLRGLLALPPSADANVVYSFHFYDPAELTALAAYRPDLDAAALARLPFPMDPAACAPAAASTPDPATAGLIRFVCAMEWNDDRLRQMFATAGAWARRNDAALLLGEFGASVRLNPKARLAWLAAARMAAEREGIGWALWGYDDGMGLDVSRPPPARPALSPASLEALGLEALGLGASRAAPAPARSPRRSAE